VVPGCHDKVWWRCPVNPSHEWEAVVHNRAVGNGCPFCRLVPRSRNEIILAHELLEFFDLDPCEHAISVAGKIHDVDIVIPDQRLIVEFDGSYWHRDKFEVDKRKSLELTKAGWHVIRAREEPLEPTGPNDVSVPQEDYKATANRVLAKICEVCSTEIPGFPEYVDQEALVNIDQAEAFIKDILTKKAEVTTAHA